MKRLDLVAPCRQTYRTQDSHLADNDSSNEHTKLFSPRRFGLPGRSRVAPTLSVEGITQSEGVSQPGPNYQF